MTARSTVTHQPPPGSRVPAAELGWLLENLQGRTPGARHALVLSRDGLRLCHTPELSQDQADQLAAISAGIQSLSQGASVEFGDGTGGVRQSMTEFYGGILFIVEAGDGAHLAIIADEEADVGLIGHNMNEIVEQLGDHLSAPPRVPGGDDTDPGAGTAADGADGGGGGSGGSGGSA